jgi:calcium permeable stress-gated cation channel
VAQRNPFCELLPSPLSVSELTSAKQILGIIGGLLPSAVLAILMSFVPGIMQRAARFAGVASEAEVELFTQNGFFMFQLVQVFLIRTITDTASSAIVQIVKSPTLVFSTLAEALPTSSNFYISYFIIEGITIAIDVMTQCVGCVVFGIAYKLFAKEPRAMYKKWTTLSSISWGGVLPVYTGIVVISKV